MQDDEDGQLSLRDALRDEMTQVALEEMARPGDLKGRHRPFQP